MGKKSIVGGVPGGGVIIDQQPTKEFELRTFEDGPHPVYAAKAFVGGRELGFICDNAQMPLQSVSAAFVRAFLSANGWAERVPLASVLVKPSDLENGRQA